MPTPMMDSSRISQLIPELMARSDEIERERRIPSDLAQTLAEAGVFRLAIPKVYGGLEQPPAEMVSVIEQLARADGSAGWCAMIGMSTALLAAFLPNASAREIYGTDPHVITGGAIAPAGRAVEVDGGYQVSGLWQWGSGSQNCQWLCGGVLVMDGDQPRCFDNGMPQVHLMFFKGADVEILDTWYASGLRGTGSHDFRVQNVLVPKNRSILLGVSQPVIPTPLYRFPFFGLLAVAVSAVSLGLARRAIAEFVTLANGKTPTWQSTLLAERSHTQSQLAKAEAAVRSARAFVYEAINAAWDVAQTEDSIPVKFRRDLRLAAVNATRQSAKAVDLMYEAGGGSSIQATSPLQRCFRDVHVTTQHVMVNSSVYEQTGNLYLGMGPVPALL